MATVIFKNINCNTRDFSEVELVALSLAGLRV